MPEATSIAQILDERHAAVKATMQGRDLAALREFFSPGLTYEQANGVVISRDDLLRGVARQFRTFNHADSSYVREHLKVDDAGVTETLAQVATARVTVFVLVHRLWRIERRGEYTWSQLDGVWRISAVRVLTESVRSTWRFGPKRPAA